jgi:hypothetical protein
MIFVREKTMHTILYTTKDSVTLYPDLFFTIVCQDYLNECL